MHCRYLAELAATLSIQTPTLRQGLAELSETAMVAYWTATRQRLDLWDRALARHRDAIRDGDPRVRRRWWIDHQVMIQEIFVSELLTRVMAALASQLDRVHQHSQWSPVTQRVFESHLDVSNRVARLLIDGRGPSVAESVRFNRLRLACNRWNDTLIGQMIRQDDPEARFATDPSRAREVARDHANMPTESSEATLAKTLAKTAMVDMLKQRTSDRPALPNSTSAVARSVLLAMQSRWFDCTGVLLPGEVALQ